jgi:hypothetical protein
MEKSQDLKKNNENIPQVTAATTPLFVAVGLFKKAGELLVALRKRESGAAPSRKKVQVNAGPSMPAQRPQISQKNEKKPGA